MFFYKTGLVRRVQVHPKYLGGRFDTLHMVRKLLKQSIAENSFSEEDGYIVQLIEVKEIGRGYCIPLYGFVEYAVVFDAVVLYPVVGEIIYGEVDRVTNGEIYFHHCCIYGAVRACHLDFVLSYEFEESDCTDLVLFDKGAVAFGDGNGLKEGGGVYRSQVNPSKVIEVGSVIRVKITDRTTFKHGFFLLGTMNEDYLGPVDNPPPLPEFIMKEIVKRKQDDLDELLDLEVEGTMRGNGNRQPQKNLWKQLPYDDEYSSRSPTPLYSPSVSPSPSSIYEDIDLDLEYVPNTCQEVVLYRGPNTRSRSRSRTPTPFRSTSLSPSPSSQVQKPQDSYAPSNYNGGSMKRPSRTRQKRPRSPSPSTYLTPKISTSRKPVPYVGNASPSNSGSLKKVPIPPSTSPIPKIKWHRSRSTPSLLTVGRRKPVIKLKRIRLPDSGNRLPTSTSSELVPPPLSSGSARRSSNRSRKQDTPSLTALGGRSPVIKLKRIRVPGNANRVPTSTARELVPPPSSGNASRSSSRSRKKVRIPPSTSPISKVKWHRSRSTPSLLTVGRRKPVIKLKRVRLPDNANPVPTNTSRELVPYRGNASSTSIRSRKVTIPPSTSPIPTRNRGARRSRRELSPIPLPYYTPASTSRNTCRELAAYRGNSSRSSSRSRKKVPIPPSTSPTPKIKWRRSRSAPFLLTVGRRLPVIKLKRIRVPEKANRVPTTTSTKLVSSHRGNVSRSSSRSQKKVRVPLSTYPTPKIPLPVIKLKRIRVPDNANRVPISTSRELVPYRKNDSGSSSRSLKKVPFPPSTSPIPTGNRGFRRSRRELSPIPLPYYTPASTSRNTCRKLVPYSGSSSSSRSSSSSSRSRKKVPIPPSTSPTPKIKWRRSRSTPSLVTVGRRLPVIKLKRIRVPDNANRDPTSTSRELVSHRGNISRSSSRSCKKVGIPPSTSPIPKIKWHRSRSTPSLVTVGRRLPVIKLKRIRLPDKANRAPTSMSLPVIKLKRVRLPDNANRVSTSTSTSRELVPYRGNISRSSSRPRKKVPNPPSTSPIPTGNRGARRSRRELSPIPLPYYTPASTSRNTCRELVPYSGPATRSRTPKTVPDEPRKDAKKNKYKTKKRHR